MQLHEQGMRWWQALSGERFGFLQLVFGLYHFALNHVLNRQLVVASYQYFFERYKVAIPCETINRQVHIIESFLARFWFLLLLSKHSLFIFRQPWRQDLDCIFQIRDC